MPSYLPLFILRINLTLSIPVAQPGFIAVCILIKVGIPYCYDEVLFSMYSSQLAIQKFLNLNHYYTTSTSYHHTHSYFAGILMSSKHDGLHVVIITVVNILNY